MLLTPDGGSVMDSQGAIINLFIERLETVFSETGVEVHPIDEFTQDLVNNEGSYAAVYIYSTGIRGDAMDSRSLLSKVTLEIKCDIYYKHTDVLQTTLIAARGVRDTVINEWYSLSGLRVYGLLGGFETAEELEVQGAEIPIVGIGVRFTITGMVNFGRTPEPVEVEGVKITNNPYNTLEFYYTVGGG